ncbi:ER membrane protein complex subunit 10 [Dioscorea cayenensis subsp. rotundata]|uniref:ER membrane protein complex subunit 10 n=1 Tax=Dioscorea cayennensis subsp. rotundata TaxID=55577 RepID=A0AB40AKB6_DIOCR|nr:ER membrane protein complex subunit 10 [Dioscorea cayenensis subsp. rotundata]XP_039115442.1 ER membrane protein complex subunit 10 [Dioscorea cayenensis subsp. rotundata]
MGRRRSLLAFLLLLSISLSLFCSNASADFQSDELLQDDDEFGLEGARSPDLEHLNPIRTPIRRRSDPDSFSSSDSKAIQFTLEHAFGDSGFSPAGTFTARLKSWNHGGHTLTKLRFSRNALTHAEKEAFEKLLKEDDFYIIRVPSNVLSPGPDYIVSSIKARCLPRETLDEQFVIHAEGVNILAVNYGSAGPCQYPRPLKFPAKWSFNSYTLLKTSEQAPRTPAFAEELLAGENGEEEGVKPPEKSFWAKYWMYLIPLGLIVMNTVTQAMNMPEEQAGGQSGTQAQQTVAQRGPNAAARRR